MRGCCAGNSDIASDIPTQPLPASPGDRRLTAKSWRRQPASVDQPLPLCNGANAGMDRYLYKSDIGIFLDTPDAAILGSLAEKNSFALETSQRDAWLAQIQILKAALRPFRTQGRLYLEYSIPRLGGRIDAVVIIRHVLFIVEFKVGERHFTAGAIDQVWDYALDMQNFHEPSHNCVIAPVLIATQALTHDITATLDPAKDRLFQPIKSN